MLRDPRRFASVLILVLLAAAGPGFADSTVRTLEETLDVTGRRSVGFDGTVGEVKVVGVDGDSARATVHLRCEREGDDTCREAAEKVDLRVRLRGDRVQFDIEDWPKLHNKRISFEARLEVPRHLALEIDMGVGEIDVRGMEDDVEIDVGVGEITVEAREAVVGHVELDTGVGEARVHVGDRTIDGSGFVGSHLTWKNGPGDARIEVDSGVGEIDVTLK